MATRIYHGTRILRCHCRPGTWGQRLADRAAGCGGAHIVLWDLFLLSVPLPLGVGICARQRKRQVDRSSALCHCPERRGVALAMEEDEAPHPVEVSRLRAYRVVLETQDIAHLVQEFFRGSLRHGRLQ